MSAAIIAGSANSTSTASRPSSEWVKKTVDFAVERNLYLHAHCDEEALLILFSHNPKAKIIWAHTGFSTPPERVAQLLATYPELWGELSYRSGIVDGGGKLSSEWSALFTRFPDRFLHRLGYLDQRTLVCL